MLLNNLTRILLVHGAAADGSSWSEVIPYLQSAGHQVMAVQEPLSSIPNDIAVVKNALTTLNDQSSEPILVAGHSFGGLVITNAIDNSSNVGGLVYVQAFAPDESETVAGLLAKYPPLPGDSAAVKQADGRLIFPEDAYLQYFAPDVPAAEASALAAVQGPFDSGRFTYTSGRPAWREIDNLYYVVGSKDQIIPPDLESFFAKRMGANTTVLEGASHLGLISHAQEVAEVILDAARAVKQ